MARPRCMHPRIVILLLALFAVVFSSEVFPNSFQKSTAGATLLGTPASGSAIDNKLDPGLRFVVRKFESLQNQHITGISDFRKPLFDGSTYFTLLENPESGIPDAPVFIKLADPSAISELEQRGVQITARSGNILVARVPVSQVYSVASLQSVLSMRISGISYPYLNLSRPEAKVDAVHAGSGGLDRPYKGNGVVVGVLDSGIDWAHPDFSISPGNTRIRFLFDYSNGPNGREWTKAEIDAGQCTEIDGPGSGGHGTHVAGIAAGGGKRNSAYIGMAPESDIVFVKGIRDHNSVGGFADADVATGTQYIFTKAQSLGKPAVVNLSLGGHYGPHDGTSLYEQFLSNLTGPGRIIVAAAGNEGSDFIHCSYSALPGSSYNDALETFWELEQGTTIAAVDMWYPAPGNISVGLAAYTISGGSLQLIGFANPVAPGTKIEQLPFTVGGTTYGIVTIDATTVTDPNNGDRNVLFVIESNNGTIPISDYIWSIYTFGSGTLDMWVIVGGSFPTINNPPTWLRVGDNNKSVGIPSTARKVICVGSYVSKTSWVDIDGVTRTQSGVTLGQISGFSSMGPSRDNRIKPDFVAPGEAIIAALSSSLIIGTHVPRATVLQGGGLQRLQGTSMASPHVAGVVALMLEKNRFLTYDNVVTLLKGTAVPVGAPNNTYGSGKMNALNAMLQTPKGIDCATLGKLTGVDCDGNRVAAYELLLAYPNPFNPATTIAFRIGKREMVNLSVYDLLGRHVKTLISEETADGLHQVIWDGTTDRGHGAASGVYYARLSTPTFTTSNRLVLTK